MSTYVLDTNILLSEGKQALYYFGEDDVVVPLVVLQELDSKKTDSQLGYMARSVLRELNSIVGDCLSGMNISLGEGFGTLSFWASGNTPELYNLPETPDGRILTTVLDGANLFSIDRRVELEDVLEDFYLVTKDLQMTILAHISGIQTTDITIDDKPELTRHITKVESYYVDQADIDTLYRVGEVRLDPSNVNVPRNIGVILVSSSNPQSSALAVSDTEYTFTLVEDKPIGSVVGRSAEQKIAINMLQNKDIDVVSLTGPAGSGKSFLAMADAIDAVENGDKERIIVYRPINPVGGAQQELGFLPGTVDEKMEPHRVAIHDTVEAVLGTTNAKRFLKEDKLFIDPVAYVRGRTIKNTYIILEEAQNLPENTLLSLLTRAGTNVKVVMVWDMSQRDNTYIKRQDGVYRIVRKLTGNRLFGHVPFSKSERSRISAMAVEMLGDF